MKKIVKVLVVIIALVISGLYLFELNRDLQNHNTINFIIKKEQTKDVFDEDDKYILSVLACEMPASYSLEALKAQAIAARTFALYRTKIEKAKVLTNSDQCTYDEKTMKEKWGTKYDFYYDKLKNAVEETKNIVILKNRELLKTFYFSTSNGFTESSLEVFKEENIESVTSEWDKNSKDYLKTIQVSKKDLESKLGNFKNIKISSRNNTNHVLEIFVDDKAYTGIQFRKILGLRSTDFDIVEKDGIYNITTRGYGHGVGLSQYGANYMALNGKNFQEILKYYYGDIDIQKFNV